jgi:hypothetical protein
VTECMLENVCVCVCESLYESASLRDRRCVGEKVCASDCLCVCAGTFV